MTPSVWADECIVYIYYYKLESAPSLFLSLYQKALPSLLHAFLINVLDTRSLRNVFYRVLIDI